MEKITRGITGRSGLGKPQIEFKQQSGRYRGRRGAPLEGDELEAFNMIAEGMLKSAREQDERDREELRKAQEEYDRKHPQKIALEKIWQDSAQKERMLELKEKAFAANRAFFDDPIPDIINKRSVDGTDNDSILSSNILPIVGIVVVGGVIFYVLTRD